MRWVRFSQFDFDDRNNVYLYVDRRGPLFWVLLLGVVFGAMIWFMDWAMQPDWVLPATRGKGAWPMALIYLMPLPVRAIAFACFLALTAETFYRLYHRMYDGRSAFVIGPTGVARIDRWCPCSLGWDEVQEIRREMMRNTWGNLTNTISFAFLSRTVKPPRHMPAWLWEHVACADDGSPRRNRAEGDWARRTSMCRTDPAVRRTSQDCRSRSRCVELRLSPSPAPDRCPAGARPPP